MGFTGQLGTADSQPGQLEPGSAGSGAVPPVLQAIPILPPVADLSVPPTHIYKGFGNPAQPPVIVLQDLLPPSTELPVVPPTHIYKGFGNPAQSPVIVTPDLLPPSTQLPPPQLLFAGVPPKHNIVNVSDTASVSDAVAAIHSTAQSIADTVSASDSLVASHGYPVPVTDTIVVLDSVAKAYSARPQVTDTLTVTDGLQEGGIQRVFVSDTISVSEGIGIGVTAHLPLSETVSLIENLSINGVISNETLLTVSLSGDFRVDGVPDLTGYTVKSISPGAFPVAPITSIPLVTFIASGSNATILDAYTVQIPGAGFTSGSIGNYLFLSSPLNNTGYIRVTGVNSSTTVTVDKPLLVDPHNGSVPWTLTSPVNGLSITTTKPTNGETYELIVRGLLGVSGDPVLVTATYQAVSSKPRLLSSQALGNGQVLLTFSETMLEDRFLTSLSEYSISGPTSVKIVSARTVGSTQVVLQTLGLTSGSYNLTVNASGTPHDIAGNPIDASFNEAAFSSSIPESEASIFTDYGPISRAPLVIQTGTGVVFVSPTTITLTGGTLTTAVVGLSLTLTGSSKNSGTYRITSLVSATEVRVLANFQTPDSATITWTVFDPRNGQIADDPSDVMVTVNGNPVTALSVIGLLGQVVLPSVPAPTDDVQINYSWVQNPTVEMRRLNSKEFRLNSWNRDVGYIPDASRHHYRYNNVLTTPSLYVPLDMQATLTQPLQRDLKYRAYERAYTPVLNDPNLLTLNTPNHRIAFPPLSRTISSTFVSYEATILPENDPVSPWTRIGTGTTTLSPGLLTVQTTTPGPFPTGQLLYWSRPIDLTFPNVYAQAWRMNVTATPTTEGVFTGIAAGYSDESVAVVVGYLVSGGVNMLGFLVLGGGNDPSVLSAWSGGIDGGGNPTGAPVAFDWSVIHSYRIFRSLNGTIGLFVDGDVTPTLQILESQAPYLEELTAPFNEVEGAFWGSLSREAANTSVWEFVLYDILPTNPYQTAPSVFVNYEANTPPELASQPWTPIGSGGTETIINNLYPLLLDSTSATTQAADTTLGLVGGDFKGFDRIEPLLAVSSDVILDVNVQLRTFTHGIAPNAVMAAIDDGDRLTQLCFFPDTAAPKLSYGGRSLPTAFTPYTWTSMGGQTGQMYGRTLRITDTSVTDGLVYFIDDGAPITDATSTPLRVVSPNYDYMLEFRARVQSFTPDSVTHFCGADAEVYDGMRSVGMMLTRISGVPNVSLHSDGTSLVNFPFNWNDGKFHTYRLVKSTGGNLVSLFIDAVFIGSEAYSSFSVPGGTQTGVVTFGSSTPATNGALSVVDWEYCNAWRVLSSFSKFVGIWKGYDPNALTGYHLPLKISGPSAQIANNALGDGSADFIAAGVTTGDPLIIDAGSNKGVYTITSVSTHTITIGAPGPVQFPSFPTTVAYRIPSQIDWTQAHRYRVVRDPGGGVSVLLDSTNSPPLIFIGYNDVDLPSSLVGVPRIINNALPSITWGALDPTNISQTVWNFVRYGITRAPSALRIVPPHEVLNQRNVMASYERHLSTLPHTLTDFWSESEGIPPELYPDFLKNPGLVAYTLLNEGTPLVPSTQTFEVNTPTIVNVPISSLNNIADVLNTQSFVLNDAQYKTTLVVPNEVLYNSLSVIERDTGAPNLIADFDDWLRDLGTLFFQQTVCLTYNADALPEQDPMAITPWTYYAQDHTHVSRSVFANVLTYGTDSTGTITAYSNATPLPDSIGMVTQVTYRLKLLSDASFGLGDSQVRFGLSAPGMTLSLGFVTSPIGERYVLVFDQKSNTIVGGRRFDFLDGSYHTYRVVRDPTVGRVSIFIDS